VFIHLHVVSAALLIKNNIHGACSKGLKFKMVDDVNSVENNNLDVNYKVSLTTWTLIALSAFILLYVFQHAMDSFLHQWEREEYSHAYLIPFICAFFVWQKTDILEKLKFNGSWAGILLALFGLGLYVIGALSAIHSIMHYAIVITVIGFAWSYLGGKAFKTVIVPFLMLLFLVPLPGFIFQTLSGELQLISSKLGVAVIRLFDISVFLEGNVIDLGVYKLQVVEACNGLRYLFPLVTISFIVAYIYDAPLWKRAIIFLSAIPITVFMNSFRIGVIGVMVEYWGQSMAEGFLHDFEGWIVFMACIAVLILEMWLLAKIGKDKKALSEIFIFDMPEPADEGMKTVNRVMPVQFYVAVSVIILAALTFTLAPERKDIIPDRASFADFPVEVDGRKGYMTTLDQIITDSLKFDDYIMADYVSTTDVTDSINVYIGYYGVQRADKVPHSPKACIPGGGWAITGLSQKSLPDISISDVPLEVNRLIIQRDEHKQLVYYWFQQRDRVVTNEYLVKWYLLVDSIVKHRSDGALMRFVTVLRPNESEAEAEQRLEKYISSISAIIPDFVPTK